MQTCKVLRGADKIAPLWYKLNHKVKFVGGFVRWMVSPNHDPAPPGDIDIYPNNTEDRDWVIKEIAKLGLERLPPASKAMVAAGTDTRFWHVTKLASTATLLTGQKVQVINPVNAGHVVAKGTMDELLNNFDFTVTRAGLVSLDEAVVDDEFIEDEMARRLVIKEIHCPIGAVKRIAKYTRKGYYCSPSEIYKLFVNWDERNSEYKDELREALAAFEGMKERDFENVDYIDGGSDEEIRDRLAQLLYVD